MSVKDLLNKFKLTMEGEVIQILLQGNDTQCFSTKQFVETRDKWLKKELGLGREELGLGPIDEFDLQLARKQLRALPAIMIKEVSPNIWIQPEGAINAD